MIGILCAMREELEPILEYMKVFWYYFARCWMVTVIDVDFRDGNISPADKNLEFIKQCVLQLPVGKKFDRVWTDSAGYQAAIFNYCEEEKIKFTVSAPLDKSIQKAIDEANRSAVSYLVVTPLGEGKQRKSGQTFYPDDLK